MHIYLLAVCIGQGSPVPLLCLAFLQPNERPPSPWPPVCSAVRQRLCILVLLWAQLEWWGISIILTRLRVYSAGDGIQWLSLAFYNIVSAHCDLIQRIWHLLTRVEHEFQDSIIRDRHFIRCFVYIRVEKRDKLARTQTESVFMRAVAWEKKGTQEVSGWTPCSPLQFVRNRWCLDNWLAQTAVSQVLCFVLRTMSPLL